MTKRIATLTSWILLVLGIAAFAGSALAGNGNGNNGNGNGNAAPTASASEPASQGSPPASPGNSANAPGHTKTQSHGGGSAIQTSTAGVKPSNATVQSKDTHALATSNKTKLYGNGQTAGQIAVQAGYTGMLHGPGNSQPHKAALCPGGHEVDVHALKAKNKKSCGASQPTTSHQPTTSSKASVSGSSHAAAVSAAAGASAAAPTSAAPTGGVLGVTTAAKGNAPAGGVLGAIEAVGQGKLPFTGFPLWLAAVTALSLVVFGLTLRRLGRETA
jgi:hypothetical protein